MSISVRHPIFGEGELLGSRWNGEELLVKFENNLRLWIHESELTRRERISLRSAHSISEDTHKCRRIIEAFRLGIVPHFAIDQYTFGRSRETSKFEEGLDELEIAGGSVLIVEGGYGAGKSHFLDYTYNLALKRGFVVAQAQLDPFEISPYRPMNIYREFMRSLRYCNGDRECTVRDLLKHAASVELAQDHEFLAPALNLVRKNLEDELLWLWIEGDTIPRWYLNEKHFRLRAPIMLDHSTAANNYCYILSGLAFFARTLGFKGLVLFVDEAEIAFRQWYSWNLAKGLNFLVGLILTSLNRVNPTPRITKDLSTGLYVEELEGMKLIYNGVKRHRTPYVYRIPSGIFLVIATTPLHACQSSHGLLRCVDERSRLMLSELDAHALEVMFSQLVAAYTHAYPGFQISHMSFEDAFSHAMERRAEGIRFFIKASVEALDIQRHSLSSTASSPMK